MTAPSVCVGCKWARWLKRFPNAGKCTHPSVRAIPRTRERAAVIDVMEISRSGPFAIMRCPTREAE